jgi:hypothetical protein
LRAGLLGGISFPYYQDNLKSPGLTAGAFIFYHSYSNDYFGFGFGLYTGYESGKIKNEMGNTYEKVRLHHYYLTLGPEISLEHNGIGLSIFLGYDLNGKNVNYDYFLYHNNKLIYKDETRLSRRYLNSFRLHTGAFYHLNDFLTVKIIIRGDPLSQLKFLSLNFGLEYNLPLN